jgi:hypothetical protein
MPDRKANYYLNGYCTAAGLNKGVNWERDDIKQYVTEIKASAAGVAPKVVLKNRMVAFKCNNNGQCAECLIASISGHGTI